ncbi:hypothetical protein ACWZJV_13865 [Nocardioides sp. WG-D5]
MAAQAEEFIAAARLGDVDVAVATTDKALLSQLIARFREAYGAESRELRALIGSTLVCVDCATRWPTALFGVRACPSCRGKRAILHYRLLDPDTFDLEDVAALRRLWRDQAARWWQRTARSTARCDVCNIELVRPAGSLAVTDLLCDGCVDDLLTDGLMALRRDPYAFGGLELELARPFRSYARPHHLQLDWESLFSKFGFNDGDVPEEFDAWRAAQGYEAIDWALEGDWHTILDETVRAWLLPATDREVVVTATITNHNPIRAVEVDGVPAEDFDELVREGLAADLQPEYVEVPYPEVEKVLQRTENGLFPLAEAVRDVAQQHALTPRQHAELRSIVLSTTLPPAFITDCAGILVGARGADEEVRRVADRGEWGLPRTVAAFRAADLVAHPELVRRTFDLEHWSAIHRQLFHDIDEAAGVVRPDLDVDLEPALAALREITAETAADVLAAAAPELARAKPFMSSGSPADGDTHARRVFVQHALERAGLRIDWKWFDLALEPYSSTGDNRRELFERAVS